jgi:MFS family permease
MTHKIDNTSDNLFKLLFVSGMIVATFFIMWTISNTGTAIILLDLPYVLGILLAGFALGWGIVKLLAPDLGTGQKFITAMAAGLPILSLIVLGLGVMGTLHFRYLWLGIVIVLAFIGVIILYKTYQNNEQNEYVFEAGRWWPILLIILIPFLVITLLAATVPAGILWPAEGSGYDVLEYHLQGPKEWLNDGNIHFLEHNIYTNFPANAEMLYLLAMILKNDPYEGMYIAQLIHVAFAVLFVTSIWVFCRPYGRKMAVFATVSAGSCPWLPYLGPLAYVEMGMLFTGVTAMGLIFRGMQEPTEIKKQIGLSILVGLLLGFSAGFKYTALAMIAAPMIVIGGFVLLKIFFLQGKRQQQLATCNKCDRLEQFGKFEKCDRFKKCDKFSEQSHVSIYFQSVIKAFSTAFIMGIVSLAALSPWLVRNVFWSGNPVFPLAYDRFGGRGWDVKQAERFKAGHSTREDEKPIVSRLKKLYQAGLQNEIVNNFIAEHYRSLGQYEKAQAILIPGPMMDLPKFGFALLILPWWVFFTRKQKSGDWLMLIMILMQTAVWLFMTHLQARFLVPWLIVLPFLVGRSAEVFGWGKLSPAMILMTAVLLSAAGLNFKESYNRFGHGQIKLTGAQQIFLKGQVPGTEYLEIVNEYPSARVMLIGEARPFYLLGTPIYWTVFNRNDLAVAADKSLREAKAFITKAKPDYIFVNWNEIERLSQTYGFDESITPRLFNSLSKPGEYRVVRMEKWGPIMEYADQKTPARVLYQVIWNNTENESNESLSLKEKIERIREKHPIRNLNRHR